MWADPFGIMEWCSRKSQASLFLYWGRAGLPIPFRANVTMVIGKQIFPAEDLGFPPCDNPPQEQVEKVHALLLEGIESSFNEWKDALGWSHKTLRIV